MKFSPALPALMTDAFGAHAGVAQYNRDFLEAPAEAGAVSSTTVVPRHAPDLPGAISLRALFAIEGSMRSNAHIFVAARSLNLCRKVRE
jgi:hypothetical protein